MSVGQHLGVFGAGSWGTALAVLANRAGSNVTLYARNTSLADQMSETRINPALPDQFIDPSITITNAIPSLALCDAIILAVPAQAMRAAMMPLCDRVGPDVPLLIAAKGIEEGSGLLMHEVVARAMPHNPVAIISGPNFAAEAAAAKPTASVVASHNAEVVERFYQALNSRYFRLYDSDDPVGVQLCGAMKNVLAIACGITEGAQLGENARAAVMSRGMVEIARLVSAKKGKTETLLGLAGVGDISLTCSSKQSRNYLLGTRIGHTGGVTPDMLQAAGVVEGAATANSALQLAKDAKIDMPIARIVKQILHEALPVSEAVAQLLARPNAL
jgi:glycerol-3-phosphate dehydrogenase (NAD(P)+)